MSETPEIEEEAEPSWSDEELELLRQLIEERRAGEFLDREQSKAQIEKMLAEKRKKYGV